MSSQDWPSVGPSTTTNSGGNDVARNHVHRRPSRRDTVTPANHTTDSRLSWASYITSGTTDRSSSYTTATEGDYENPLGGETSEMEEERGKDAILEFEETSSSSRGSSPGLEITRNNLNLQFLNEGRRAPAVSVASRATTCPLSAVPHASLPFPPAPNGIENGDTTSGSHATFRDHESNISDTRANGNPFTTRAPSIRSVAISQTPSGTGTRANSSPIPSPTPPPIMAGVKGSTSSSQAISSQANTRTLSSSYTRAPNPPMTAVTRHRRLSSSGTVKGSPVSNSTVNGIPNVNDVGIWRSSESSTNLAVAGMNIGSSMAPPGTANGSPITTGRVLNPYHASTAMHSKSSSSSTIPPTGASTPPSTSSFVIVPASPLPRNSKKGYQSRPDTGSAPSISTRPGTGNTAERETFSSPPVYTKNWSTYGVSGSSTPQESFSRASSTLALTAHVPGLAGSIKTIIRGETPDELKLEPDGLIEGSRPLTPDGIRLEDDGGLRTKSYLLQGEIDKPWLRNKDWREGASWWITFVTIILGIAASAAVCWVRWNSVLLLEQPLCLVMQDEFNTFSVDHDDAIWRREVDMSGFGNGEFEMATSFENNSFVKDGMLYIMPTLTSIAIGNDNVFDGFTYNITGCTNEENLHGSACGAVSNKTSGTVINPIMSARLTTQKSHSIRYGSIEIRAKMPTGDWLWPALWMLPVNDTYGAWPLSGEIDIVESRGNGINYPHQGSNVVRGSLNWGPTAALNSAWRTFGIWYDRRNSFANDFHVYRLEWTPNFIRTSVDNRLHKMLELRFNEPFFTRGQFPPVIQNGSQTIALQDPWFGKPNSAPFDQPFFLIMNVAVGGINGWFPDNVGGKPWLDHSETAMRDFALAQDTWYPTWPQDPQKRAMVIDYVKMWELC